MPIRLMILTVVLVLMVVGYFWGSWLPRGRMKKLCYKVNSWWVGRLFLLGCGYFYIHETIGKVEDYLPNYPV